MNCAVEHTLYYQEDPEPNIGVLCSASSVSYNTAEGQTQSFYVQIMEGSVPKAPDAIAAVLFNIRGGGGISWPDNVEFAGVTLHYSISGTTAATFTLEIAQNATCEGVMMIAVRYKGTNYLVQIPFTRVVNGANGAQGPRGIKGPYIRGPRDFMEVVNLYQDVPSQMFYSGSGDEPFIDVVVYRDVFYACVSTHSVSTTVPPIHPGNTLWAEFSSVDFIATKLLLAHMAKIKNLIAEGIEMRNNSNEVVFAAYKDNNGVGHVYASEGTFENVVVEGDIRCNTQTYSSLTPTDTVHLNDGLHVGGVISIRPEGGCLIVPGGKSDIDILLPEVEEGTVRQITVINQHLPFHAMNIFESGNGRHIYIRPDPDAQNVVLFPKLTTCDDKIDGSTNNLMDLEYGAYNLYGYRAKVYDRDSDNQEKDITAWSMWRTDSPTYQFTTPTKFEPSEISSFGGYNKTLQTGLPPIQTL